MKDHLKELIEGEDKKNPYTDDQLAKMLNLRRDVVTILRNELNIPDSRERRKPYLLSEVMKLLSQNPNISDRQLTRAIRECGFNVSRFLISQIVKEIKENSANKPSKEITQEMKLNAQNIPKIPKDLSAFKRIIGFDGSLKPQIQQAKAAILYPPNGLHTLILGPTGVGKSNLAEAMYEFALETGTLQKNAPFIIFNCADYAENPQLLLSQLFGHIKGAYTGAVGSKEGLVEKADGGILFLDEVHRLPPEGQEILYFLIDKGKFRRMGETETERTASVLIIAATTEDIESSLLFTFRRRIPMIIELPTLAARPLDERYQIIKEFFNKEADRIGVKVKVTQEALRALLLYDCPGNIGQLRSDIQVACARGFLNFIGKQKDYVEVDLIDLPVHARRGLLKIQNRKPEVETLLKSDLIARPGQIELRVEPKEDLYTLPGEIYQYIEERFQELEVQGLNQDVINAVIGEELESKFQQLIKRVESSHKTLAKHDLEKIVGKKIIELAEKVTEIAGKRLGRVDKHLFYCLAVHLYLSTEKWAIY
ncbi:MAG TPA: sigma 54-interacting transcriptional regulator [Thermoanaerobacterales bacterium]|nr:sigma 54-interacting transcriptional regulator [Thermoanaerobacterales bacterium]